MANPVQTDAVRLHRIQEQLDNLTERIESMAKNVKDYTDAISGFMDRLDKSIDGVTKDVKFIKDKLDAIQNSPGTLSSADQEALDAALSRLQSTTEKLETLDAATEELPDPPADGGGTTGGDTGGSTSGTGAGGAPGDMGSGGITAPNVASQRRPR